MIRSCPDLYVELSRLAHTPGQTREANIRRMTWLAACVQAEWEAQELDAMDRVNIVLDGREPLDVYEWSCDNTHRTDEALSIAENYLGSLVRWSANKARGQRAD